MNAKSALPSFSVEKARKTQLRLSKQILFEDKLPERIMYIAGVDVAYTRDLSIGAVAVLDYASLKLVEAQTALYKIRFPYIPTLLSFRETQPTVLCIKKLKIKPDVFLVDGHGFAHPYRCGFASHFGLVIDKPTIGVAKNILLNNVKELRVEEDVVLLEHNNEIVGAAVTTKKGFKPVYVSVGHMISLETAIKIVKNCARASRVPEPILRAHEMAETEKRKINITFAT
ncbi:MAG: endonuclease V [Candidatus Bathycorpusculaceae bacterium]